MTGRGRQGQANKPGDACGDAISEERQAELRAATPAGDRWGDPIRLERAAHWRA